MLNAKEAPPMMTNLLTYLEETVVRLPDKTAYSDGTDSLTFRE